MSHRCLGTLSLLPGSFVKTGLGWKYILRGRDISQACRLDEELQTGWRVEQRISVGPSGEGLCGEENKSRWARRNEERSPL